MEQEWYFYIVRCRDNSLYSGITNNIENRLKEHNRGVGAKYTLSRRPVKLVYSEKHDNMSSARKRESQIKSWSRLKKERIILGFLDKARNKRIPAPPFTMSKQGESKGLPIE